MKVRKLGFLVLLQGAFAVAQPAQPTAAGPRLEPIAPLAAVSQGLVLRRRVRAGEPFTVAGPRGVLVGQQEGTFEAWLLPVKLLSHFSLSAQVAEYPVPIELNPAAAEIEVYPDRTVITYTHIALTVRQTMFAPQTAEPGTGAVVLFEIDSVRPVDLTFRFTPEMRPMWPKPGGGQPSAEWVAAAGAYVLHTDFPDLAGAIAMPTAQPGVMAPYQEKPQTHPLELHLHYDPTRDRGKAWPLLMAVGQSPETASNAALLGALARLDAGLPQMYAAHAARYAEWQAGLTSIVTPDARLNEAFGWATLAIEQLRATTGRETGLVAGYYSSGDSARPGFGWYFGRDTLYTLYAVNGMGDFALAREAFDFLIRRQRADGKMMHEFSQTAGSFQEPMPWSALPYEYAAADATPLFLLAMADYARASGDVGYVRAHRDAILRAWEFERTHDSDGDGVYDNAQGTGWVESWPGGQPHQEIYLALLDQQASHAMGQLASVLGEKEIGVAAEARALTLRQTIEREYYLPASGQYAFSRNADGSLDRTNTLYPALAWWSGGEGLMHPAASLKAWDSHDFSTDWGTRDVAESDPVYDPMSYHQGSVWPLFTGWAALADYRSGHALSGYAHLMQNALQTDTQDLGAVTELLSGAYFTPFGRSTSHQLWSSAMVVTPTLRGLFGLTLDGAAGTITVDPHLPADWPGATVRHLHVGASVCDLVFERGGGGLRVSVLPREGVAPRLAGAREGGGALLLPLPVVEAALPQELPLPGARTAQLKVLGQTLTANALTLVLEGTAGTDSRFLVRRNGAAPHLHAEGAELAAGPGDLLEGRVSFGGTGGYQTRTVTLRW